MKGAGWRDQAASEVAAGVLGGVDLTGPVLVVDDEAGQVEALVERRGLTLVRWRRRWAPGVSPLAWPPDREVAEAVVRLPKGREALEMTLHAVAARLVQGGRVWLVGANDEGIKSAGKRAAGLFGKVETVETRRHCRAYALTGAGPARGALDDWAAQVTATVAGRELTWTSFPGLFAHGRLDPGTAALLEALPELPKQARVLDYACGPGVIAMTLRARDPSLRLDLLDNDALALEAARRNLRGVGAGAEETRWLASDGWAAVPRERRYDLIVSNPPLHAGKGSDRGALSELVAKAPSHLAPQGRLLLVTQRAVPMGEWLARTFASVRLVRESRGYRVWGARPS